MFRPFLRYVVVFLLPCFSLFTASATAAIQFAPLSQASLTCVGQIAPALRADCNGNSIDDSIDLAECDWSPWCLDCNTNGILDICDIQDGTEEDCNRDGIPDSCPAGPPEGYALQMDGVDDHVDFGTNICLTNLPMSSFGIEMWIKTSDTSRSILLGNYNGNPSWSLELHDSPPAGQPRLYLDGEDHMANVSVADGKWHHLAVVRRKSVSNDGYVRMYIDGKKVYEALSTKGEYTVANSTMLGRDPRPNSHYYGGVVDEVRVWALLLQEWSIRESMYTTLTGSEPGLAAYWRLDDGEGTTATDVRGFTDGTIYGDPVWYRMEKDCNDNGILDECDLAPGPIHSNLVHRYCFDEDAIDSQGHSHGQLQNGASSSGGALILDGIDDYVELPLADTTAGLTQATYEAWFTWAGGARSRLFSTVVDTGHFFGFSPHLDGYWDGVPNFIYVPRPDPDQWLIASGINVTTNALTHVAVTMNGDTDTADLYINGSPVNTNTSFPHVPADLGADTINWLARSIDSADGYFAGQLLEYRVYDAALADGEVSSSFLAGRDAIGDPSPFDVNENGIIDECEGPITDCNSNGIDDGDDLAYCDGSPWCCDCNTNGVLDTCDLADCDADPACDDCNNNGIPDQCDIEGISGLHQSILHRYIFETDASDSIAGADGVLQEGASVAGGALLLDGTDDYAELPLATTMAGLSNITLEAWVTWSGGGSWQRIFDIGTSTNNYMFLTPSSGGSTRFVIRTPSVGEQLVDCTTIATGTLTHLAVTLDSGTTTATIYVNGSPIASNPNVTLTPADLEGPTIAYLGKSFWPDPYFNGQIHEFRVYGEALSDTALATSYAVGPNVAGGPLSSDVNSNGIPDECEIPPDDCNTNGITDSEDLANCDGSPWCSDCNTNGVIDVCDIDNCDGRTWCDDCNGNDVPDICDIMPAGSLHSSIVHRYSFETDASDTVGGAHAILYDNTSVAGGSLVLDGSGDYAELPVAATTDTLTQVTYEAWFIWEGSSHSRLFATGLDSSLWFGFSPYHEDYWEGQPCFIVVPRPAPDIWLIGYGITLPTNTITHVAVTMDDVNSIAHLYIDGQQADTITLPYSPAMLGAGTISYLGRSFSSSDGWFDGDVLEYRIYNAALVPEDIMASFTFGPDAGGQTYSADENGNGIPDECEIPANDCNSNGIDDLEDLADCDGSPWCDDCNSNGILDTCDLANCDGSLWCDDCNTNGIPDGCDGAPQPAFGNLLIENTTGIDDSRFTGAPDDVFAGIGGQILTWDFGDLGVLDGPGPDINVYEVDYGAEEFSTIDVLVSVNGVDYVSIRNSIGPVVRVAGDEVHGNDGFARSYQLDGTGYSSVRYIRIDGDGDAAGGETSGFDLDAIAAIFSHVPDCNDNGVMDECDIANGLSDDINGNLIPDECESAAEIFPAFYDCLTGPGNDAPLGCEPVDFDHDGDVDLADFAEFQRYYVTN